jgi:hypothetical protein
MLLRTAPVVWHGNSQVTGDSINLYLSAHQLHEVRVLGSAFAVSRNDTLGLVRFDQLSGASMVMRFEDRKLQELELNGRSRSLYHLFEDSLANGMNKASGDRITMRFAQGKMSSITIAGGVEGQYIPENLVAGRESTLHLPGFVWRNDRPIMHADERTRMSTSAR